MSKVFLIKSTLIVTFSEIVFNLSSFIIHAVVGRILGPQNYGRYGLVVTLTTMIIILIGNGIPTAMTKYLSECFDRQPQFIKVIKRKAVIAQTVIIGSLTLLFFLAAPLTARLLGDPTLTNLFRLSSLIIPAFAAASFYFSYYSGLHKFNIQAFLKISRSVLRLIIIIGLTYFFHVEGSVAGYIIAPSLIFLLAYAIDKLKVEKEINEKIKANPAEKESSLIFPWRNLISYAWQIVVFFLAYELMISIDLYLVKRILADDYLTGIYNASLNASRIPYYLFYALTIILLPTISSATANQDFEKARKITSQSLRIVLILIVPLVVVMINFSLPIIEILFGQKYLAAAEPMKILLWGVGFLTIFYILSFVMNGAGKIKTTMLLAIGGASLNAFLNVILIKKYGLLGSAAATSLTAFASTLFMIYFVKKSFGKLIEYKNLIKIFLAGTGAFFFAQIFSQTTGLIFIFYSLLTFLFYLLILYLLDEIKKDDISFFKNLITRRKDHVSKNF